MLNWTGSPGSIANQDKILFSSTAGLSQSFGDGKAESAIICNAGYESATA